MQLILLSFLPHSAWLERSISCCRATDQQRAVADCGDDVAGGALPSFGAEFLAAAQVIVYAGAIMVLFTFVVMLLNAGARSAPWQQGVSRVGFPAGVAILGVIATVILSARASDGGVEGRHHNDGRPEPRALS